MKYRFFLWIVIFFLSACQSMAEHKREEALDNTLRLYESIIRWHGPDKQARFLKDASMMPVYQDIRVVDYNVISPPVKVKENIITQLVEIRYLRTDTQVVNTLQDRQLWEGNEEGLIWQRQNPPPQM